MLQGALHIHSTWSDGEFSLGEVREILMEAGCRFACVTDHADGFDDARLAAYRRECEQLSDARFVFIPGLEYSCAGRMHIIGYGHTERLDTIDPETVIRSIRRNGGVAVIAHPRAEAFEAIERFDPLPDGIEVWNSKYDGQYAPRSGTFALLSRLQGRRPDMRAYYGIDLHWRRQFRGLFVEVACETIDADAIMKAVRRGEYAGVKGQLRLRSDGVLPPETVTRFEAAHERSERLRRVVGLAKRLADKVGFVVPRTVKAQLRRIF
jgi:hypothetical protein